MFVMSNNIQQLVRKIIAIPGYYSGINYIVQKTLRLIHGPKLIVINYHRITDSHQLNDLFAVSRYVFEKQITYLKDRYNIISFSEVFKRRGELKDGIDYLVITFDDGYEDNFINAVPILLKHKVRACFFITTELIDHFPEGASRSIKKYPGMKSDDLKAMRDMGFEIGAHTLSHPNLLQIPLNHAQHEISESREQLEQILQQEVTYFAYPGGKIGIHYNNTIKNLVAAAGYELCCTTNRGRNSFRSFDMLDINRITVRNWWSPFYFAREIEGIFDFKILDK